MDNGTPDQKAKLTETLIKNLTYSKDAAKNERDIWWDTETARFGIRVNPGGTKSFVIDYRYNRKRTVKVIGRYGQITLVQARQKAKRRLVDLGDGIDPEAKRDELNKAMLFRDFAELYIARQVMPHHKGWKVEVSRIRGHLVKHFGSYPVISITHNDVAKVHLEIGSTSKVSANRIMKILSAMLNKAVKWDVVPGSYKNPVAGLSFYREQQRERYVTTAELPRLIEAIEQEDDIYPRSAFWLYLLTGFRKSELLKATWSQVDFDNRVFILPDSKGGRPHHVPLTDEAIAVLEGIPHLHGNPHIFPGEVEGNPLYDLKKPWKRIRQRAGLGDVHLHDLRHTFASWIVQDTKSLYLVQQLLNHKDPRTTARYAHFAQDNLREAVESNAKRMTDTAGKKPG